MRILWYSNALWGKSGYANQTRLAVEHLSQLGHKMAVACNYGLRGGKLGSEEGVVFYPAGYEQNSNDIVQAHADDFKADLIISLYDAWPLKFQNLKTPWVAWTPVDHQPVPEMVVKAVEKARRVVAYSVFGQREFQKAGISAGYIPHGVDTALYTPGDKLEARKRLGLSEQAFIVGMVGTNVGYPSRKCIPQALQAFAAFRQFHPEAVFYLHTEETGVQQGLPLKPLIKNLGLGPEALKICDQYHYAVGFPEAYMVDMYRALDVLLSPSMGEGFGLPILEAQACGTPVIVNDATAMPELVGGGWVVTELERWWEPQGGWQVIPHVDALIDALEQAYVELRGPGVPTAPTKARLQALQYDFASVVAPKWASLLDELCL